MCVRLTIKILNQPTVITKSISKSAYLQKLFHGGLLISEKIPENCMFFKFIWNYTFFSFTSCLGQNFNNNIISVSVPNTHISP